MADQTRPSEETRKAEAAEAGTPAHADRPPTEAEASAAGRHDLGDEVAEHERDMLERGADERGEGRLP